MRRKGATCPGSHSTKVMARQFLSWCTAKSSTSEASLSPEGLPKCAQDRKTLPLKAPEETHDTRSAKKQQRINRTKAQKLGFEKDQDEGGLRIPNHGKKAPRECLIQPCT